MTTTAPATVYRIGIDVGGTFTDMVAIDASDGRWSVLKVPSTPSDPSIAVLAGLEELIATLGGARVNFLGHGTTVATNAFLTKRGALTVLLTTEGFEDVLEVRRMDRSGVLDPYDLQLDFPPPLVPGRRRLGVRERIGLGGTVVTALTDQEIERVMGAVVASGAESVAVSLLWSFEDPSHEQRLVEAIRRTRPGLYVSASHEIDPGMLEYERTSTTVMNSYLGPLIDGYLQRLGASVSSMGLPLPMIMQSNGGMTSVAGAVAKPVTLLESGPAAGVAACAHLASQLGIGDLLAVDMGGTSFETALILDGTPQQVLETEVEGYAVRTPMLDIRSIGAGGGSLAWIDDGGALRVGPDSAGADPGPVCYGRGGTAPTVTDANLVLGYAGSLAGGRLTLDRDAAEEAIRRQVAEPLGLGVVEAASGIHRVVNAHMADAMRIIASERGISPVDLVLVAYGGAGPMHAAALARELDIARTVVPPHPGALCALGAATSDVLHDYARSVLQPIEELDLGQLKASFAAMEGQAAAELAAESGDVERVETHRYVVARYVGQLHHIEVQLDEDALSEQYGEKVAASFHERHRALYGFAVEDESVFVISARLRAVGRVTKPQLSTDLAGGLGEPVERRRAWFDAGFHDCPVFDRSSVQAATRFAGPAIVTEYDATTVVLPGQEWHVDAAGCIVIEEAS